VLKTGFASGFDQTSSQNPSLSRRSFLLAMTSLLALGLPQEAQARADFTPFSFAFISDIHLCSGLQDSTVLLQESQLFLQDVVKQLNMRKLDFVIFGGDQVEGPGKDDSYWNLFIDVLQILNAPWYFILGEADVSGRKAVDKMVEYGPDFKGRGLTNGKPYWSADPVSNVHLIGLDTAKPNTTTGDLSTEQLAWLKSDLEANHGKFTIALSHHPLLAPPPYDGGPPWDDYMVLQGASAREILAGSRDVRLCVSGHVPINKVQQEGGIWYVSAATVAMYPCQFKIFTVSPESIHVETLQISYDALVKKAKKIMETSRLAFQYSSSRPQTFLKLAEGEELDRNALLPLVSGAVTQKGKKEKNKGKGKEKEKEKEKENDQEKKPAENKRKKGKNSEKENSEKESTEKENADKTCTENTVPDKTDAGKDGKSESPPSQSKDSGASGASVGPTDLSPAPDKNSSLKTDVKEKSTPGDSPSETGTK